jgi:hypothetical protein
MTPKDFQYALDAYNENMEMRQKLEEEHYKQIDYQAWLTGIYVKIAVGNVLGGKKSTQYPQKPLSDNSDSVAEIAKHSGRTEEEINADLLMATLQIQEANARIEEVQNGNETKAD